MASSIHYTTMLKILHAPEPVSLKAWKKDGSILSIDNAIAIPTKNVQYSGCKNFKILTSGQIRKIRLVCIFQINNLEVFL